MVDTTAPNVPTGLVASNPTATSVTLEWNPTADTSNDPGNTVVTAYEVYKDATLLTTINAANAWTKQNGAIPYAGWQGITYGGGKFVVVGLSTSIVAVSSNGLTWTSSTMPGAAANWMSVTYGNGIYVAIVQNSTRVATSPDGITWTERVLPGAAANWYAVTYGNGMFVATASSSTRALSSPDGITWTDRVIPGAAANWRAVTYGNGMFVAAVTGTNNAASSPDGITWTARTLPASQAWGSITYGNGMFVAVASTAITTAAASSPDGITWTARTMPGTAITWGAVAYSNGLFVAVSSSAARAASSPDGITWTARDTIGAGARYGVAGANGFFVCPFYNSSDTYTFDYAPTPRYAAALTAGVNNFTVKAKDALNNVSSASSVLTYDSTPDAPTGLFTSAVTPTSATLEWSPAVDDVVVTAYEVYKDATLLTTINAANTWTNRTGVLPASTTWWSVTYGNGLFVAFANTTNIAATSPNGLTWTYRTLPSSGPWLSIGYGNGLFVGVTNGPAIAVTSPDGITWTQRAMPSTGTWRGVSYGNGMFIAVRTNSDIAASSPDGITWTQRTFPSATTYWQSTAYGDGMFVAVADGPTTIAASSPDGITWTQRVMPTSNNWISVAFGNGMFVAVVSGSGIAASSPDGVTWTARSVLVAAKAITFSSGLFVVVSDSANSSTSPDGITWTTRNTMTAGTRYGVAGASGFFVSLTYNTTNVSTFDYSPTPRYVATIAETTPLYNFSVVAKDALNNSSAPASLAYSTAPDTPTGLALSNITPTSAVLNWIPTRDDVLTTAYEVYNGASLLATINATSTWTDSVMPEVAANWNSVTSGNGIYVAIATSSTRAATSPDGITWTERVLPGAAANWYAVTYGNGIYVAVANNSTRAATSPDGITWTDRVLPGIADTWRSVTYGTGTFVAVAWNSTRAVTSPDGITWTDRVLPGTATFWQSVTYGNGTFVAVAGGTSRAATSPDGITWTSRTLPGASANWWSVTYGEPEGVPTFAVVAANTSRVATSPDGITWTDRVLPGVAANWNAVTYSSGLFMAVANTSTRAATSPDGITWTDRVIPGAFADWRTVTGINGYFVTVAYNSTRVATFDYSPTPRYNATLSQGTNYNFNVKAKDAAGNVSPASTALVYRTSPDAPVVTTSKVGRVVTIQWNQPATAILYEVFRDGASQGTTATTSMDQTVADGTYSYTVKAKDNQDRWSAASLPSVISVDLTPPTVPVISSAVAVDDTVTVTWGAVATANLYEVFRDDVSLGTQTSTTFTEVIVDGTYEYTVRAKDAANNWSAQSLPSVVVVDTAIQPPRNLRGSQSQGRILLEWDPV